MSKHEHFCCSSDPVTVEGVRVRCGDAREARVLHGAYYHMKALGQDPDQLNSVNELHDHKGTLRVLFDVHQPRDLIEVGPALAWAWENIGEEPETIEVIPYVGVTHLPKERRRLLDQFLAAAMLAGDCLKVMLYEDPHKGFCYRDDYREVNPGQLRWAVSHREWPEGGPSEGVQRTYALFDELPESPVF